MDPLTLLGSAFMGGGGGGGMGSMLAAAKPNSQASGGTALSSSSLDSSNWQVSVGSSGGGFSPVVAGASVNWLMIAALVAAALWLTKKL